ncbi:MAG: Hsp20/alpha crystallin family protein [Verrucomicrobia bacterium]|nr:Hsp20/alpha crystallin family protein [Verrucomicrobiota bacterium]
MTEKNESVQKKQAADVELTEDRPVFIPAVDIYERKDAILVRCDMPGVDEASLDISLEDRILTLVGCQAKNAPEGHELLIGEYATGIFRRAFTISNEIDHGNIKARIKDGVLNLELPKAEKAQPKKITVQAGA